MGCSGAAKTCARVSKMPPATATTIRRAMTRNQRDISSEKSCRNLHEVFDFQLAFETLHCQMQPFVAGRAVNQQRGRAGRLGLADQGARHANRKLRERPADAATRAAAARVAAS